MCGSALCRAKPDTGRARAASVMEETGAKVRMDAEGLLANIADAGKVAPFQPWAKGLYEYRQKTTAAGRPDGELSSAGRPAPVSGALRDSDRRTAGKEAVFVMSGGGNRNWRLIHLDGRAHQPDDVIPDLLRRFGGQVGRRHAGHRHDRFQRAILVHQRRSAAHGKPASDRAHFAARLQHTKI